MYVCVCRLVQVYMKYMCNMFVYTCLVEIHFVRDRDTNSPLSLIRLVQCLCSSWLLLILLLNEQVLQHLQFHMTLPLTPCSLFRATRCSSCQTF